MSNFTKNDLYNLFNDLIPNLATMMESAEKNGLYFIIEVSPTGRVELASREYTKSEKGEDICRKHYIYQSPDSVSEGSETYKLK